MWSDIWSGETIGSALSKAEQRYGSREAMVFENGRVTYSELQEISGLLARALIDMGIQRGDMVAVWIAGYTEWAYLYYALARIGAIIVPVNTRYKPNEMAYVLNKCRARVLFFKCDKVRGKNYLKTLQQICPELEKAEPGHLTSKRLPFLQKVVAVSDDPISGCLSFEALLESGRNIPIETLWSMENQVKSGDTALLQFTSGTTAQPKGAMLHQSAMLRGSYYNNHRLGLAEGDRFFSPQPFFHAGGSIHVMLAPVVVGSTVIVQAYFEPGKALRLMEKHRCTVIIGHQPHYIEYLNHPDLKKRKLYLKKGYAFAPPEVKTRVVEEMGIDILISPYSLTETHLGGTVCWADDPPEKRLMTVGRLMPGLELNIREPGSKKTLPPGETGEICFRGWCVMEGYFDDLERTAEVIDDEGWFRTGDLGLIDVEGYLRIVGRVKDMIRVGGENVAAQEVETYLLQNDQVKQAVVVGAPDPRLGEVCAAFVELKGTGNIAEEEILKTCRSGLASFKVPRRIIFVKEWPMTGTGKIQKYLLKESLEKGGDNKS